MKIFSDSYNFRTQTHPFSNSRTSLMNHMILSVFSRATHHTLTIGTRRIDYSQRSLFPNKQTPYLYSFVYLQRNLYFLMLSFTFQTNSVLIKKCSENLQ